MPRKLNKNKVYLFQPCEDAEYGVFVAAPNWKQGRNMAILSGNFDYDEFICITGSAIKEDGQYVLTDKSGELTPYELLEIGVTNFWWENVECQVCGKTTRVAPVGKQLLCYDCEDAFLQGGEANA